MKTQWPNNQWLDDNAQPTANRQMDTQPNFTSEMLFGISGPQPMVKEEGGMSPTKHEPVCFGFFGGVFDKVFGRNEAEKKERNRGFHEDA